MAVVDLHNLVEVRAWIEVATSDPKEAILAALAAISRGDVLPRPAEDIESGRAQRPAEPTHIVLTGEERGWATRRRAAQAWQELLPLELVVKPGSLPAMPSVAPGYCAVLVAGAVAWVASFEVPSELPEEALDQAYSIANTDDGKGVWQMVRPDRTPGPGFIIGPVAVIEGGQGRAFEVIAEDDLRELGLEEDPRLLLHEDRVRADAFRGALAV